MMRWRRRYRWRWIIWLFCYWIRLKITLFSSESIVITCLMLALCCRLPKGIIIWFRLRISFQVIDKVFKTLLLFIALLIFRDESRSFLSVDILYFRLYYLLYLSGLIYFWFICLDDLYLLTVGFFRLLFYFLLIVTFWMFG